MKPTLSADGPPGFSLVENMLAIAVVAMVALPLVGMLAVSTDGSRSSEFRLKAALLANQIAGDLQSSTGETGLLVRAKAMSPGGTPEPWPYLTGLQGDRLVSTPGSQCLHLGYGADLQPKRSLGREEYESGRKQTGEDLVYLVELEFVTAKHRAELERLANVSAAAIPGYAVFIRVTSPAGAPLRNRQAETYATWLAATDRLTLATSRDAGF